MSERIFLFSLALTPSLYISKFFGLDITCDEAFVIERSPQVDGFLFPVGGGVEEENVVSICL